MKIAYYYLDEFPRSQRSVKAFAPEADWVYTERGKPSLYPLDVASRWNKGDSLLVVEGDIVVTPMMLDSMRECGRPWCVYAYPIGISRYVIKHGYGFTKWSAEFQAAFDYRYVLTHTLMKVCPVCREVPMNCKDCEDCCCHLHQDASFWHEMMMRFGPDISPHVHGVAEHLHYGQKVIKGAYRGVYFASDIPGISEPEAKRMSELLLNGALIGGMEQ